MPSLHHTPDRESIGRRVRALRPDMTPRWGRMRVDQMLWHVNAGLANAVGELPTALRPIPIPRAMMRLIALYLPWPKAVPTAPEMVAGDRYDFDAERDRCLALIDRVAATPLDGRWPVHPAFGAMNGPQWTRLEALHLAHHLKQFGV